VFVHASSFSPERILIAFGIYDFIHRISTQNEYVKFEDRKQGTFRMGPKEWKNFSKTFGKLRKFIEIIFSNKLLMW
jgi:hypothetical protein